MLEVSHQFAWKDRRSFYAVISDWSKYIQIGAFDCARESTSINEICLDEKYPQWRIYCPLTNSSQLAFDTQRLANNTTAEEILMWSLEKLNAIASQCYGPTWPIRQIIAYVDSEKRQRGRSTFDLTSLSV